MVVLVAIGLYVTVFKEANSFSLHHEAYYRSKKNSINKKPARCVHIDKKKEETKQKFLKDRLKNADSFSYRLLLLIG